MPEFVGIYIGDSLTKGIGMALTYIRNLAATE